MAGAGGWGAVKIPSPKAEPQKVTLAPKVNPQVNEQLKIEEKNE